MNIDEIRRQLKVIDEPESGGMVECIATAISRLPEEVQLWAVENLHFLRPNPVDGASYCIHLPASTSGGGSVLRLVYISAYTSGIDAIIHAVVREVAGHRLGYTGTTDDIDEAEREAEAVDRLMTEWGFDPNTE